MTARIGLMTVFWMMTVCAVSFVGRRRNLYLREYNKGDGDWETLCRSIALLKDFYKPQGGSSGVCRQYRTRGEYLSKHLASFINVCRSYHERRDIEMLSGLIYCPAMVAWCAVCHVKGATCYEMCKTWEGDEFAQTVIKIACLCFDNLTEVRYTDEDIARMSQQQRH